MKVTLPIAFKSSFYIAITSHRATNESDYWTVPPCTYSGYSLSEFKTMVYSGNSSLRMAWMAVGQQQWGRYTVGTISFPLTMSTLYSLATVGISVNYHNEWYGCTSLTGKNFYGYSYGSQQVSYIAIGKQRNGDMVLQAEVQEL